MEIAQDEYDEVVGLLRTGDRGAAFQRLRELVEGENEVVFGVLDQIADQEGIAAAGDAPPPPTAAAPGLSSAAPVTPMGSPVSSVSPAGPTSRYDEQEEGEGDRPNIIERLVSLAPAPLVLGGWFGVLLAVLGVAVTTLLLKDRSATAGARTARVVGVVIACYAAFFIPRFLAPSQKSPYFSDRNAVAESPPEFLVKTPDGGAAPEAQAATGDLRFDFGVAETHIIAVGFHESAGSRTNVAHFDPVSREPLDYPIEYAGERWRYERVLAEGERELEFDTDASGKTVLLKDEGATRYQDRRLFRTMFATSLEARLVDAWLVDRKTKRLLATMPKGDAVVRGAGVTKIDFFLRNWHSAEWDLYCDFRTYDRSKPRDEQATAEPTRVKFELPRYEVYDVADGEVNLFEVEVPFYRPKASLERDGYGMTGQAEFYKEGKVSLGRILGDVAQMVMYDLDEELRGKKLKGIEPQSFEGETPYQILRDSCRSAGYELVIDDEARTISVAGGGE